MNNISMISNTHYLYYCTQIVADFALTHYFTWIPTILVGIPKPPNLEIPSRPTNVSHPT
jgi:hypothetical protein